MTTVYILIAILSVLLFGGIIALILDKRRNDSLKEFNSFMEDAGAMQLWDDINTADEEHTD